MTDSTQEGFLQRLLRAMQKNRAAVLARKSEKDPLSSKSNPARPAEARNSLVQGSLIEESSATAGRAPAVVGEPDNEEKRSAPGAPVPELRRYAYVNWLLNALTLSLMVNVFVVVVLFVAGWQAGVRPQMQLTAPNSLRREADITFGKEDVNLDDLLLFINTVLPLIHRMDDRGSPDLPLLRGLVAPDIFERAEQDVARQSVEAKKHFIVQNLVVTRIEDVEQDAKHGRVSCYVRGYLAIIVQSSAKNVILPYRAELLLEMAPPSRLNRFPFVLVKRDWKIGQAALDWDVERGVKPGAADDLPSSTTTQAPKAPTHAKGSTP